MADKIQPSIENDFIQRMAEKLEPADVIDDELYSRYDVKRGLRNANGTGVVVGLTKVSSVEGYKIDTNRQKVAVPGKLYYRGYDIEDLMESFIREERFGFEEITYLLLFGELPTKTELEEFKELLSQHRTLPHGFARDMILVAPSKNLMNKLSRSVLALYSYDENPDDTEISNVLRQAIEIIGHFPALIAYSYQAKRNYFENESLHLHFPESQYGTAENILRMIRPNGEFTELEARLLDLSLILHAEHGGGNNSSFTTHLISSTGTDTYAAISAAIGSLKGPKHGGANISVIKMIQDLKENVTDITDEAQLAEYFRKVVRKEANDKSGLVYGLGHAIYTLSDPRAQILKKMAKRLAEEKGLQDDFALCEYIENKVPDIVREYTGSTAPMPANIDLYSGFVYSALDIPEEVATPLFAVARLSGWCAHRLEELIAGKRLMRPAYICIAEHRDFKPIDERG